MACGKTILYLFAILATLHVIWGQEASGNGPPHTGTKHPGPHDSEHPENSEHSEHDNSHNERASMSFPSFPGFGGFGSFPFSSMFGSGGSGASGGDGSDGLSGSQAPNPFSSFMSMFGPREAQVADPGLSQDAAASEHDESDTPEHQNRLFFSLLSSRITTCNYTAQPGARCLSCTRALNCRSNNIGIVRRCFFLQPYCNNGRCSKTPGTACTSTSAAATSATEATTTT